MEIASFLAMTGGLKAMTGGLNYSGNELNIVIGVELGGVIIVIGVNYSDRS